MTWRVAIVLGSLLVLTQVGSGAEVAALEFDHPSGFCTSAFTLGIHCPAEKVLVYYTTNGTVPQPLNATLYTEPIAVTTTTVLRAAAFDRKTNLVGTAAATFLFVKDILTQSGAQLPGTWGTNHGQSVPAHYGMVTAGERHAGSRQSVAEGLRSLASVSIIGDWAGLFSNDTGLYAHPLERGAAWERGILVEMLDAEGRSVFQSGAGLRIHGSMSRRPEESPKHSFRLHFRSRHGAAKLRFPVFGDGGAQEFDTLILRAGNSHSWLDSNGEGRRRADYLRDEWMRRSMHAMGYPSARGIFVHLYLNGLYWGLYNLCEPADASLYATTETAATLNYDVIKAGEMESGDDKAWTEMLTLASAGVTDARRYEQLSQRLDLVEFADYMILNLYAGNADWDRSANWVATRPRIPNGRFQFLVWDAERTLEDPAADTLDFDDDQSPPRLFHQLAENAAFRKLFADRAQRLLSDGGPLSPEIAAKRYRTLADSAAKALSAEAARWGTYRRDVHQYKSGPFEHYTVESHWRPEVERILTQFFPQRRDTLLNQFRERGLFAPPSAPARD